MRSWSQSTAALDFLEATEGEYCFTPDELIPMSEFQAMRGTGNT